MKPEPSALHVVATLPLHAGWLGVQTRALHVAVGASQNCVVWHVCTREDVSPFELHWRTSLLPMQYRLPAWQTTGTQAAATQTWLLAAQSVLTIEESPSAEHWSTFSDMGSQEDTDAVQIRSLQLADWPDATHVCEARHGAGVPSPLPSALQVTTAFD